MSKINRFIAFGLIGICLVFLFGCVQPELPAPPVEECPGTQTVYYGKSITADGYTVELKDVTPSYGTTPASAGFRVKNDYIKDISINEGETKNVTIGSDIVTIYMCKASVNVTAIENSYAKIKVSVTPAANVTICPPEDQISDKRVLVKFLNEDWMIADINPTAKSVTLAKESIPRTTVKSGQNISNVDQYIEVSDFDWAAAQKGESIAIINIYTKNGTKIADTVKIKAGETKEVSLPDGTTMILHAYDVKIFTIDPSASYVELTVFADTLTLEEGRPVDSTKNKDWNAYMKWKTGDEGVLQGIAVERHDFPYLLEGDSVNILENPSAYQFVFAGRRDIATDTLTVTGPKDESVAKVSYKLEVDGTDYEEAGQSEFDFVCFESADAKAFDVDGTGPIEPTNMFCAGVGTNYALIYLDKTKEQRIKFGELTQYDPTFSVTYNIQKDVSENGNISIALSALNPTTRRISITEYAGVGKTLPVSFEFEVVNRELQAETGVSDDEVTYKDVEGLETDYDVGFVSQRGSIFSAVTDKEKYTFKMVKQLSELQYYLKLTEVSMQKIGAVWVIPGSYGFRSYIYGFIDADTTDDQVAETASKTINGTVFAPFKEIIRTDTYVGKYTEEQSLLILGDNDAPSFKTLDNVYRIKPQQIVYVVTFDSDDYDGIPSCLKK